MTTDDKDDKNMTMEERTAWLKERGVQIVDTKKRDEVSSSQNQDQETESITYVLIPHDTSKPLQQLTFPCPKKAQGDQLMHALKPHFSANGENVDISLLETGGATTLSGGDAPANVSPEALKEVASQANVETFQLVRPTPANKFLSVQMYLDEVGMLKRLPLNKRASELALQAGFNPPPQFYGDIFVGRLENRPLTRNISFATKEVAPDSPWLQRAAMDNLEYQTAVHGITDKRQAEPDGVDGVAKEEQGGYSWTQTDEELEIVYLLPDEKCQSRDCKVKFLPKSIQISIRGVHVLAVDLFASIDPEGCTWTLEKGTQLVISCEKMSPTTWPRITF